MAEEDLMKDCLLGHENKNEIENLKDRISRLERGRTGGNDTLRYIGIILAIVSAMYGATAWVGRDVNVLREYTYGEDSKIRARISVAEEHANEMGHPVLQTTKIDGLESRMERMEGRMEKEMRELDVKLQIETHAVGKAAALESERTKARLDKLEENQRYESRRGGP